MRKIYQGIRNDKFAVRANDRIIRDSFGVALTFNRRHEAEKEVCRRNALVALGLMDSAVYSVVSLAESSESRPVNLNVSGNGARRGRRLINWIDLG